MSLKLGTTDIAGISTRTKYNAHDLLDFKWADHIINDMNWLEADTFSWHSGDTYTEVYNQLEADISTASHYQETIAGIDVVYYLAENGRKICTPNQESAIADIYDATGVAWYYIIDEVNTRFKLPRTQYGFKGLRNNAGNYIDESLPNITGDAPMGAGTDYGLINSDATIPTGAFKRGTSSAAGKYNAGGTGGASSYALGFDASLSSTVYQDNAPVQERGTQMYLYFYVGEYSQTAIEQTAGLNAELFNGKADVDLTNVNDIADIRMAHNAMPSDNYVDLTLGASGTIYTAPADGYVWLSKTAGSDFYYAEIYVYVGNTSNLAYSLWASDYRTSPNVLLIPVKKGARFGVSYNATGTTNYFRFIYAKGSESEAQ